MKYRAHATIEKNKTKEQVLLLLVVTVAHPGLLINLTFFYAKCKRYLFSEIIVCFLFAQT